MEKLKRNTRKIKLKNTIMNSGEKFMIVNVSKKTMVCVTILITLIILAILLRIGICLYNTRDYKEVQATVESIDQEFDEYSSEGISIVHVISFSYTVNGVKYKNCYKQLTKTGYAEGKQITVYYDLEDPGEVRPTMRSEEIVLLGTLFILTMALFLTKNAK